jgi:ankyrin repeat protein
MCAARSLLVLLGLVVGCEKEPPASPPTPVRAPAAAGAGERNLIMGTGEPRKPEPFTVDQRLLDAVRRADRPTLERALERGATVRAKDDLGRSTVLLAVLDARDLDLVRWLHAKGAALDEPDVGGRTALSFAAEAGRLDIVRYLVEHGAVVDRRDVQQRTALFHAALGDHPDVVAFLLDRGADVNARDQFGDTPLIVACAKGNAATAALLLARGADPALKDQEGRTARERSAPEAGPCRGPGPT